MFVDRDANGYVVAAFGISQRPGQEELPDEEARLLLEQYRERKRKAKGLGSRLEAVPLPPGTVHACVIRLSDRWSDLSNPRKAAVMSLLNAAADAIVGDV